MPCATPTSSHKDAALPSALCRSLAPGSRCWERVLDWPNIGHGCPRLSGGVGGLGGKRKFWGWKGAARGRCTKSNCGGRRKVGRQCSQQRHLQQPGQGSNPCLPAEEQTKKTCYVYTTAYYSVIKGNKTAICRDMERPRDCPAERSQKEKKQMSYHLDANLEKWYGWSYWQSRNTGMDIENGHQGGKQSGRSWEIGIDIFTLLGFPGGTSGEEPICQSRRHKRKQFDPWVSKIPWRRKWQPTPVFLPGEFCEQRSLVGYNP